jgi:uncharacterized protein
MTVQSAYNVVVPLESARHPGYSVLFNMLAGSVDVVDQPVVDGLARLSASPRGLLQISVRGAQPRNEPPFSREVLGYLDGRGYLFDSLDEERVQARLLYDEMLRFHREIAPMPLVMIPSYNCDLKCGYCWQRLYDMDSPIMSAEMAERAFAAMPQIIDRAPDQHVDMAVFGGEPLQNIPELRERVLQILDLGNAAGYSMKIITNGVGLGPAAPHIAGKVSHVQVTIDGPMDVHRRRRPLPGGDSFTAMVDGMNTALAHGIPVNVRVNTDATNLPRLPELADFARSQGWVDSGLVSFHVAPVKNHNPRKTTNPESDLLTQVLKLTAEDERMAIFDLTGFAGLKYFQGFKESGMLPLHRFFHCEAQINFFAFDLYGDVYACWDAAGIQDLAVGRFHPEVEIEESKLNVWRARTTLDVPGCQGCVSQPHCGGGCQFLALEHGGSCFTSNCDSMLDGYVLSMKASADWLIERAIAGDHAVGLVADNRVVTMMTRELGLLEEGSGARLAVACS